jgi:hypothetical protein
MPSLPEKRERISMIVGAFMVAYAFSIDVVQALLAILNFIPVFGEFLNAIMTGLLSLVGYATLSLWMRTQEVSQLDLLIKHPFSMSSFFLLEIIGALPIIGIIMSGIPMLAIGTARIAYLARLEDKKYNKEKREEFNKANRQRSRRLQMEAKNDNSTYRASLSPAYGDLA